METQVILRERQRFLHSDMEDMQDHIRSTFDGLILEAVGAGPYYSGFNISATGTYEVTLDAGRVYEAGASYRRSVSTVFSTELFNLRPTSQQRYIVVAGWGSDAETTASGAASEPRQFIVNTTTRETEVQNVSTRSVRQANLNLVAGVEAAQPTVPALGAGNVHIATILLDASGIVSVEMNDDTLLPQLARQLVQILDMYEWRAAVGASIDTLQTDLTSIQERMGGLMSRREFLEFLREFDEYKDRTNEALELAHELDSAAPAFLFQELETFATPALTDDTGAGFASKIDRGLRFGFGASDDTQVISPINPTDPKITITDNFALPKWTARKRLSTASGSYSASVALNAYSTTTITTKTGQRAVYRQQAGAQYTTTVTHKWRNRNYEGAAQTVVRNGTTYQLVDNEVIWTSVYHAADGESYVNSVLTYEAPVGNVLSHYEPYTYDHAETTDYTGQGRGQTFMQSHDGWIVGANLYLDQIGTPNDVRVMIVEAPGGVPDVQRIVTETTVAHGDLSEGSSNPVNVTFTPAVLEGGKRYAICILSQGSHRVYVTTTNSTGGTFHHLTSNGSWQADTEDRTLVFDLNFAQFQASRVEVDMTPMELTGGFSGAEIWAERIVPRTCRLDYEVQIGGQWYMLDRDIGARAAADLSGGNSLLPFRVVFAGSQDIMPGVGLETARSGVTTSRPNTTMRHWSTVRPFGGSASTLRIRVRVANWDAAKHTLDIDIHDGTSTIEADTIEETDIGGDIRDFVATFDISAAPLTQCQIIIDGTSADANDLFYGVERRIAAFA